MLVAMAAGKLGIEDEADKSPDMIELEKWQAKRKWEAMYGSRASR